MTRLELHTCVLLASMSSARHWSEHEGLGRALSFLRHDSEHSVLLVDSSLELALVDVLCELSRDFLVPRLLTPHRQMQIHVQMLARRYQDPHQVQ